MRLIPALAAAIVLALPAQARADPDFWVHEWPDTDFATNAVDSWAEILSGGPPRDGIPALTDPDFVAASEETALAPREPVITVEIAGAPPRAYPIRYLMWHEIVNDTIAGTPLAITFCPLCNSALVFDRRAAGRTLSFGVTGKLRNSGMVMYDRETESWWQQALGRAIVGELTGTALTQVPSWMESWAAYRARRPAGLVMAEPDHARRYGTNPYAGYDSSARPFLYNGEMPPHGIPPLVRVVRVGSRAWPLPRLAEAESIAEAGVILSWAEGQASALDTARIGEGREVGTIRVRDAAGADLPHDLMFAFAFHAFFPDGTWMLGD